MEFVCVWLFCHRDTATHKSTRTIPPVSPPLQQWVDDMRVVHYDDVVLLLERS